MRPRCEVLDQRGGEIRRDHRRQVIARYELEASAGNGLRQYFRPAGQQAAASGEDHGRTAAEVQLAGVPSPVVALRPVCDVAGVARGGLAALS